MIRVRGESPPNRSPVLLLLIVLSLIASACTGIGEPGKPTPSPSGHHHGSGSAAPSREPTAEERAAAEQLVAETRAAMAASFADPQAAREAGYVQIMPFVFDEIPAAHFLSPAAMYDGADLDPERPESLIYLRTADGGLTLLGVMYVNARMGEPLGGPLTPWHSHPDLCMVRGGIVPLLASGECPPQGAPVIQEMLHVWTVDNPDGPFAHDLAPEAAAETTGQTLDQVVTEPVVDEATMRRTVAETLGLTQEVIRSRFQGGETLSDMAAAEEVAREELAAALTATFDAGLRQAQEERVISRNLHRALQRWFPLQVELLLEIGPDDPPGGTPGTTATDFGYPCDRITCLIGKG